MTDDRPLIRVRAFHSDWSGYLLLSPSSQTVRHEQHGSMGGFKLSGEQLSITWDKFGTEEFIKVGGVYLQQSLAICPQDIDGMAAIKIAGTALAMASVGIILPENDVAMQVRLRTSDQQVFRDVFLDGQYDSPDLPKAATSVVDLGANVGYASAFFALRYPACRILAVEPEESNFHALTANTASFGDRINRVRAAVWTHDGSINLRFGNDHGVFLAHWGIRVGEAAAAGALTTACYRLDTLLDQAGFAEVDILKVDIEGAELELFSTGTEAWLPRVRHIVVETHDRFRPGSDAAVRAALAERFDELPRRAENLHFRRR